MRPSAFAKLCKNEGNEKGRLVIPKSIGIDDELAWRGPAPPSNREDDVLELYHSINSVCSQKVRIALNEKGWWLRTAS